MTNNTRTTTAAPRVGRATPLGIEDFDLTPAGLADAPANEQDTDSIVHTGNS
ncbi:hypothetical protein [Arthrobacter sp. ZGTC412]|uniref:hypothetical protein n=1 Tax=Arthrobacter sp. ZGTC412 TaxID=2058900 RepID=UPI0015E3FE55|nr:hypothetical protein [Arthrobacter sp. ZGTC412]